MILAIRGIEAHLGQTWANSFLIDQHKDLKADYILANPPFSVSDWSGCQLFFFSFSLAICKRKIGIEYVETDPSCSCVSVGSAGREVT